MAKAMILGPTLGQLGSKIGAQPKWWVSISMVISIAGFFCIFLLPPTVKMAFESEFTTPDAESVLEMKRQVEFFGNNGKPWYMALFARATDEKRSIVDDKEFQAIHHFYDRIKQKTIRVDAATNKTINYFSLCGRTCSLNELYFKTYALSFFGLEYPVTSIFSYDSNIGKHLYDVTTEKGSRTVVRANMTMLVFMAFSDDPVVQNDLVLFEKMFRREIETYQAGNRPVKFTLYGAAAMSESIRDGMMKSFVYVGIGFLLACVLQIGGFLHYSRLFDQIPIGSIPVLWAAAVTTPICAYITAFATYNLLGYTVSAITMFTPFLAILYCFFSVMMLVYTWLSDLELRRDSSSEHLLEVFATCMPSILLTATPGIGFLLCSLYPIENYAAVSVLIGLTLIMSFLFIVIFFAPLMVIIIPSKVFTQLPQSATTIVDKSGHTIKVSTPWKTSIPPRQSPYFDRFSDFTSKISTLKIVAVIVFTACLVIPTIYGDMKAEGNLDYRQLLTPDAPPNVGVHYMSDIVWPQYFTILFFVNKPANFSNELEFSQFKSFMDDVQKIENKLDASTDMIWINDFLKFTNSDKTVKTLQLEKFQAFITDPIYQSWKDGVRYEFDEFGNPRIKKMLHIVSFKNTKSLQEKAKLFAKCREVTRRYKQFDITPFDTEIGFADIIVQTMDVVFIIPFAALFIMFLMSIVIIGNFIVAILNFLFSLLLYFATIGIPSIYDTKINPFTACYLLILAALAPTFTTHFSYFYQQAMRTTIKAHRSDRLVETLRKSVVPFVVSVLCSIALFLPTLVCPVDIFRSIAVFNLIFCSTGVVIAILYHFYLNLLPSILTGTHLFISPRD